MASSASLSSVKDSLKVPQSMARETEADSNALRVVLLGKTGVGKSSTGNTLLQRQEFQVGRGLCSSTERCQWAEAQVEGITLQVTDTPGLSDTHRSEDEVLREVGKSIAVASPGPHVILIVIRCDARYTPEESMAYLTLKEMFGPNIKDHTIVVFVGLDSFGDTMESQEAGLREEIHKASGSLQKVLDDADGRFFGLNNKASRDVRNRQGVELIDMIKELKRQRGGTYFHNSISDKVNELVAPLVASRSATGLKSRAKAIRETNLAIVDGTESPNFFSRLLDTLQKDVLPVLKKGLQAVKQGLEIFKAGVDLYNDCSIM